MTDQRTLIREMMGVFSKNGSDLIKVSTESIIERDRASYGLIIAKPTRRLATALGIDREIVVLFSSFREQQQRTVKAVDSLIQNSKGRYESTVAIIIHKDNHGNQKLKNWGRELGLSILPYFIDGQEIDNNSIEKNLRYELYSHDPFDVTGPVSNDSQFYGRRTEATELARKLQFGQIRSCLGIRKIGKTSILNRIVIDVTSSHNCICIMIDCSKDEIWGMNANQLMLSIAKAVEEAEHNANNYISITHTDESISITEGARKLTEAIKKSIRPVIIFMDEVDYITPGSPTASHWTKEFNVFWRNFRAVYQESSRDKGILSLLISGVSSKWFSVESINNAENAALSLIPEEYLSPLPRGATVAMIKKIARTAGLQFEENACNLIASVCADMPFWVRKACSYIHRHIEITVRPISPDSTLIKTLLSDFVEGEGSVLAQVAIRHLLRVYPELEPATLSCSLDKGDEVPKHLLAILEKYGVIEKRSKKLSGSMLEHGFMSYLEQKQLAQATNISDNPKDKIKSNLNDLSEWADELAIINKRRNILEKRLRQIVLNFIRFDALNNGKQHEISKRVMAGLPENYREKISHLSPEDIVEKLMWIQLVEVIKKEWKLFERLFNDKSIFIHNCNIINDRYDTHAKDVDEADLALYRRSLKGIETCIENL